MSALEAEDEFADFLEVRRIDLGRVLELGANLCDRSAQFRIQLRVDRVRGLQLGLKRLQQLVQVGPRVLGCVPPSGCRRICR